MILRSTIVKLLQHQIGMFTSDGTGDIPPAKSHIPTTQQVHTHQHSSLHYINLSVASYVASLNAGFHSGFAALSFNQPKTNECSFVAERAVHDLHECFMSRAYLW